jgi:hypothetical protein
MDKMSKVVSKFVVHGIICRAKIKDNQKEIKAKPKGRPLTGNPNSRQPNYWCLTVAQDGLMP